MALDVGTGAGRPARKIARRRIAVTATDQSAEALMVPAREPTDAEIYRHFAR
ncbi:MAG: hypothetical protein JXA89_20120 [Anaerolineae bacterium]|nr:hypothetical protein [Anaerolineae bacterium]